jgi:hypothetical protein
MLVASGVVSVTVGLDTRQVGRNPVAEPTIRLPVSDLVVVIDIFPVLRREIAASVGERSKDQEHR